MEHALSVDVEEFFQIHALSERISPGQWDEFGSAVEENTSIILDLLEKRRIRATFFCLGWIASRHRGLIKKIHSAGHEIACHGYSHQVIFSQTREDFRQDITKAKKILEDITGEPIRGYRAPTYSITKKTLWALDIIEELGFSYDSSIFPIRHDNYGIPDAPRFPYRIPGHNLAEFPISTMKLGRLNMPVSGGGYFRLLPYPITKAGLYSIAQEGQPFMFYIHPWEFNPDNPRLDNTPPLSRFRTYVGLKKTAGRFERLIDDFDFTTTADVLAKRQLIGQTHAPSSE